MPGCLEELHQVGRGVSSAKSAEACAPSTVTQSGSYESLHQKAVQLQHRVVRGVCFVNRHAEFAQRTVKVALVSPVPILGPNDSTRDRGVVPDRRRHLECLGGGTARPRADRRHLSRSVTCLDIDLAPDPRIIQPLGEFGRFGEARAGQRLRVVERSLTPRAISPRINSAGSPSVRAHSASARSASSRLSVRQRPRNQHDFVDQMRACAHRRIDRCNTISAARATRFQPRQALPVAAAVLPHRKQRRRQSQCNFGVARFQAPRKGRAKVVHLAVDPMEMLQIVGPPRSSRTAATVM